MKTFILSLALVMFLGNEFSQAAQKIEDVWGQCQLTKVKVIKSKNLPKGTLALDRLVTLSAVRTLDLLDAQTKYPKYYDSTSLEITGADGACLPHSCVVTASISEKDGFGQNDPQKSTYILKANSGLKLDLLLSEPEYTDKLKLTYDYLKATGKIEIVTKVNDWGSSSINTHVVYNIANCNFSGPVTLHPTM